jgi:PAS domain S-box-containing protein
MKLATKTILLLTGMSAVLMIVSVYYLERPVRASFKAEVLENVRIVSEGTEATYYAFINSLQKISVAWSTDQHIRALAESIANPKATPSEKNKIAEEFGTYVRDQKIPYVTSAFMADLLNADGIVVASTKPERIGTNELKEEQTNHSHFFSKAIQTTQRGESFVRGFVYEDDETPEAMTHVTVRVFSTKRDSEGNFVPIVLLMHFLPAKSLADILSGRFQVQQGALTGKPLSETFKTGKVYLINKDRRIVVSAGHVPAELNGKVIASSVVEDCLVRGKEVAKEGASFTGVKTVTISQCLARDELVLVTQIDSAEAFQFLNNLIQQTYAGGVLVFVFVVGVALLVVRRPLMNIHRIAKVAEHVAGGDFMSRAEVDSKDELGLLARTFNSMLDKLDLSRKEMQKADEKLKVEAVLLARDVEEHKKQEAFLEESKRAQLNLLEDSWKAKELLEAEGHRLQTVLSSIGEGLVLIDGQYRLALVNPGAVQMFGMSREELLGKDLRTIVKLWKKRKDEIPLEKWPTEEMFLTKNTVTVDLEDDVSLTTESHPEYIPVLLSVAPLAGSAAGAVIVFRDATKDRELDDAKSGFISVASHQLRTPLTSIRWYSEMLLSEDAGVLNPAQRDFMSEIHGGAERLYQTVDLLLGISRAESGKMKTEKAVIDIGVFTAEIVKELQPFAVEKKVTIKTFPPDGRALSVFLDALTLRQVVLNLVSNSIRYSNEGGIVEVRWWTNEKGDTVYAVRDWGIGIPQSQQSRIFSKFFRAENALQKAPDGSGLGLALAKELVEAWDGRVWFETAEGQGTTFYFSIPATISEDVVAENVPHDIIEGNHN